jgi:glycosyltransferase involved in cell wall biosynthesis
MKQKIALIKIGSFSHVNARIQQVLATHFPGYEIDVIDVKSIIKKKKIILLLNTFFTLTEYGTDILLGKKRALDCYWRTTYFFHQIKALVSQHLAQNTYLFSFQTQSLFDASINGLPHFIYTDHTHLANLSYPGFDKKKLFSKKWIELEKTIYHNATFILTMGDQTLRSVIQDYSCPPQKVACVGVGSNISDHFETNESKYDTKNILFVGVEWERKGGPELVKAFLHLLEVHPDAHLTIVGCSPKIKIPNCHVIGQIPLEQVNYYYENASVFCLPTKLEPFGIVFLEAFAHGLPVVTTEIGAIPSFVFNNQNGFLVKPGDFEQLSNVLSELLKNPEKCRTLGENGRRLVAEKYVWERVGTKIASYIRANIIADL